MAAAPLTVRCAVVLLGAAMPLAGAPARAADAAASREEVRAEAASAARAGQIPRGEAAQPAPPKGSSRPRSEVKAETRAAVKAGTIEHGEGRASTPATAAPAPGPVKSRAEVRAEAASSLGLKGAPGKPPPKTSQP